MINKKKRQKIIKNIAIKEELSNQNEFSRSLNSLGIIVNQATLSRDLNELMIHKINGKYKILEFKKSKNFRSKIISFNLSGNNIIILKTMPGEASSLAFYIDELKYDQILGTIAGDDNIFIATKGVKEQKIVLSILLKYYYV